MVDLAPGTSPLWPRGYGHTIVEEAGSTMDLAGTRAPVLTRPEWILALRQTSGRGRRGRPWADPGGNFAASLVLMPDSPPQQAAWRSFVAALALRDALEASGIAAGRLSLKWPNDVLLAGGKVAGILLESHARGDRVDRLIVGIGVNLAHAPGAEADAGFAPVSVAGATGLAIRPEAFLTRLARAFDDWEGILVTRGFAPVRAAWLDHAARLGQVVTVRCGAARISGTFAGLDADGNLALDTADGHRVLAAAEVFF